MVKIHKEAARIITDYGYNPVIIVDGVFKGIIGVITSVEMSYYGESTCEINVDYRNTITVNCNQIAPLRDMSIFVEYGINIFNKDGMIKNGFEIIRDMEEKNIMMPKKVEYCLGSFSGVSLIQQLPVFDHKQIKNVIFNNPATVVLWKDGTKTVVKCQKNDTYNPEMGLAMCIIKKMCGNKGNYNDVFNKWLPEEK